ncbi:ABC transporter substrate-binding protein [Bradyrhizobium sp. WSM 1704]|uniref:ABC transporter substrate-binding protein n=1 Tax=Bradyrhizobium semiaridum TaxID=2821404 RepID=UPI001CE3B575|nr:ABC transporter substrate-binding protein [Bradyrhizobium semiaridum]MCA6123170.1 ABC transporter substrate-binding protein [Bradyrhizobium semiaridum]
MQKQVFAGWCAAVSLSLVVASGAAKAEQGYDVGVTDKEIKIGSFMPYSGPASSYSVIGLTEAAYFRKINDEGGINGRKINFISYDDAFSPPKTVEQARKLVESDEVFFLFNPLGTASNSAVQKYLNAKKVPQLLVGSGATKWGDPKHFPWTMGWQPSYQSEARIYAKFILDQHPNGKIAVIAINDDAGKDWVKGLRDGLGDKAAMIVAETKFESTDPTVDSQIVALKASGADVFVGFLSPKTAAQAIRKVAEIGWKPTFILNNPSTSVGAILKPAGLENARDIISTAYTKDPTDKIWSDDPGMKAWVAFMDSYMPEGDKTNANTVYGYSAAQLVVEILRRCGNDLTRTNLMKQAASLDHVKLDMLLPGIEVTTAPNDFYPIEQMQLMRFDGESWHTFGDVMQGEVGR